MYSVQEIAREITEGLITEREKAVTLHNYVRDHIKFGFNKYFDAAQPDYMLKYRAGHCNPKSRLMASLFRAIGLETYQHFVVIPKEILKGAVPSCGYWIIPAELSHSYVEVKVENIWCSIDSYIVDTPLLNAAKVRLAREGRSLGYDCRANSTNIWDGRSNAFSQFDQKLMIEDHGRVDDLEAYFHSSKYRHQVLGLYLNTLFRIMGDFVMARLNSHIENIRMSDIA